MIYEQTNVKINQVSNWNQTISIIKIENLVDGEGSEGSRSKRECQNLLSSSFV